MLEEGEGRGKVEEVYCRGGWGQVSIQRDCRLSMYVWGEGGGGSGADLFLAW